MLILTNIISFLFLIGILVFIHELGHFLAARSIGLRVEKFYIGFNLFGLGLKKKIGETEFGIGLFPIGGYVKVAGMIDESFDDNYAGKPDEYVSKNTFQKVWFTSGGVIFNFILAMILFSGITYFDGREVPLDTNVIGQVIPEHPASNAGLLPGDRIISIDNINIESWIDIYNQISIKADDSILIKYSRNSQIFETSILTNSTISPRGETIGIIGITPEIQNLNPNFFESIKYGFFDLISWLKIMSVSIFSLFTGQIGIDNFGGPIQIASIAGDASQKGASIFLSFMAILSVNLGIINILPFPGLDGGHALIAIIEGALRRRIPFKILMAIQQIGVLLLLIFFFIIMKNDILRLF